MPEMTDDHPSPPAQTLDRTANWPYSSGEYFRRTLWELVQATLFRWSPPRAYAWRRWWLRRFGADLAPTSGVRPTVRITFPWLLKMGEHAMLGDRVRVYNLGYITIGNHTVVSQDAHLCAGTHDYTRPDLPLLRPPITIGDGVWVCADTFVGPGVTIGDRSVIGARAVAVRDVPSDVVVAGNPAKIVKPREMAHG